MAFIVSIDGIIGCGKSSLINQLNQKFTCFQEPINEWSLLEDFYRDMKTFAAPFQFQVLLSFHKMYSTFKNVHDKVILERCPWSSKNIFAKMLLEDGYISPAEFKIFCDFYEKCMFKTNVHIYLKVDTDVAYERVLHRDRSSERLLTKMYLDRLNTKYNEEILGLDKLYIIDANQSMDCVMEQVLTVLNSL